MQATETTKDRFYISASAALADTRRLILKHEDLFGLFDRYGDIVAAGTNDTGLYYEGTRFLSSFCLRMEGRRLLFLSSSVDEDNLVMSVDLTNPDIAQKDRIALSKDSVHIMRSRFLYRDTCFETLSIRNFSGKQVQFQIEISLDSDFKDIFEIRGMNRRERGSLLPGRSGPDGIDLSYRGLDDEIKCLSVTSVRHPDTVRDNSFFYRIELQPEEKEDIQLTITCSAERESRVSPGFNEALAERRHDQETLNRNAAEVHTSNDRFNETLRRSLADINMMLTRTNGSSYPYGGIPWFCTPFGRDGLLTALECLWIKPHMARGVLTYLAGTQAQELDRSKAAEPGKILHESRKGEMAGLGEIPFGLYYGSVDSTPLFLMLAGAYWKRTGDIELMRELWPAVQKAVAWMDTYGDPDGDGFLEYAPHKEGLRNQGWKDSYDSIFHADGSLANGAIALCEVQGYAYLARRQASAIALAMGDQALSERLQMQARELKEKFNRDFWDEEKDIFVLALDGEKRRCSVIASNAGHTLLTGIADPVKAFKSALTLTSSRMFSGWGVRTLAEGEVRYNPMSYHNGSIWPHDNAIVASGLSHYGLKEYFIKIFTGMFEASLYMEANRLPELFCGFPRRKRTAPTLYPVACSPQTWAAGSLLFMLQASLGMSFDADNGMVVFRNPILPDFLSNVTITGLMVSPDKTVDLNINRHREGVTVEVIRKSKGVSVLTYK
jgi:glycogen debranching enzyme